MSGSIIKAGDIERLEARDANILNLLKRQSELLMQQSEAVSTLASLLEHERLRSDSLQERVNYLENQSGTITM